MNNKNLYLFAGIFLVLMVGFVFADVYNQAPSTAEAGDTKSMLIFNVTSNSTTGNTFTNLTIDNAGDALGGNLTNITVSNGTWIKYNDSFSFPAVITIGELVANGETHNYTINFTFNLTNTIYGVTFQTNVTAISKGANLTTDSVPFNSTLLTITETTDPTATATCSDSYAGSTFPCTCEGTDTGVTASGVSTYVETSTSGSVTSTSAVGEFVYTCKVTDVAGNFATANKNYLIYATGGGDSGSGTSPIQRKHSFSKMTPGVVSIVKDFDPEIGVKQITIEVINEAQNIRITVTKYDGKPAQVSKERSGDVFQYFEIDAPGLENKLEKATVTVKVLKSWTSSKGIGKKDVLVFKFDESAEKWNELETVYAEEDDTYYYYDVEVNSFSYFAISAKTLAEKTEEAIEEAGEAIEGAIEEGKKSKTAWAVLVGILIGAAVWFYFFRGKKK